MLLLCFPPALTFPKYLFCKSLYRHNDRITFRKPNFGVVFHKNTPLVGVDVHDQMASCVFTVELKEALRRGEMKRNINAEGGLIAVIICTMIIFTI